MERICKKEELLLYRLEGKWNDYIGVQKIATIRHLKQIIARAELVCDNVPNRHYENGYTYAYLKTNIIIDDKLVGIKITIKKKISVNWFWIHNIDEIKC